MQQSIVKLYCFVVQTLLNMFRALQCPSSGARQTAVAASGFRMNVEVEVFSAVVGLLTNWPRLRTLPPPHSYGNQRLQQQFDGLLMMGIVMSETCWAVSVRQSNKILRFIVASRWLFYLRNIPLFHRTIGHFTWRPKDGVLLQRHKFALNHCCVTFSIFIYLTVTCFSTTRIKCIVVFLLQQWLRERFKMLRYTYNAYLVNNLYPSHHFSELQFS